MNVPVKSRGPSLLVTGLAAAALLAALSPAVAQLAHHPFAVGANEGAVGHQNALGAWLLAQESHFYLKLTGAVRAARAGSFAAGGLIGLSFAYGVFHAAGPGHGKAVIASYMVSNEVALRRGLVIALLAAILQGLIATALVGIAAFLFNATSRSMTTAAETIEVVSYVGIVALGLLLVVRKGRALWAVLRPAPTSFRLAPAGVAMGFGGETIALRETSRFVVDDGTAHAPDCDCGHAHMPDGRTLESARFDLKAAAIAILTAGARPCSGAILVLVFALAQGLFWAGVAATFAMSLGTALTTGALACIAVFAKDTALHVSGMGSPRAAIVGRLLEFVAAAFVLVVGGALLAASLSGIHLAG